MTTTDDVETTSDAPRVGGSASRRPRAHAQELLFPTREQYLEVVGALRDEGFETCADLSRVQAAFGFAPRVPLEEGLRRFVAWFKGYYDVK